MGTDTPTDEALRAASPLCTFQGRSLWERLGSVEKKAAALDELLCLPGHLALENAARLALEFGEQWAKEHAEDDHMVTLDHKDEMELAEMVLALCDALSALDAAREERDG